VIEDSKGSTPIGLVEKSWEEGGDGGRYDSTWRWGMICLSSDFVGFFGMANVSPLEKWWSLIDCS
jgi:hypothetical protein